MKFIIEERTTASTLIPFNKIIAFVMCNCSSKNSCIGTVIQYQYANDAGITHVCITHKVVVDIENHLNSVECTIYMNNKKASLFLPS